MGTSKKILLFIFTIVLVVNLQLSGTITAGMENGFSIEQLADNIFVPSAFAQSDYEGVQCVYPFYGSECVEVQNPQHGCDPNDPEWGCWR